MTQLHIGQGTKHAFKMPSDAVTQTIGIVAVRGAGKTNTSVVTTEEMIAAGSQVVVLDPLDVWWGLRASADGKGAGLPVYVFGGEHADLPLEAAAGKLIADVVVEQGINCVVSLRHLSKSAQRRFVADFAERLYERKGVGKYQTPLHLVIDEADAFAPQRVMADTARMLGAIDDCVRRGRNAGFGVTLITQRPATLNKDVLTQIEVLICLRTISPQDRKALDEWIKAHDSEGHRDEFMKSLASLQRGEAWVWSPGWLDVFERVQIRQRRTYDSSSTPKAGEKRREPKRLAPLDIRALRERMATVVQQAEANDPRKLQARIVQLERELVGAAMATPATSDCGHPAVIEDLSARLDALDAKYSVLEEERRLLTTAIGAARDALDDATRDHAERMKRPPSPPVNRPVNRTIPAPIIMPVGTLKSVKRGTPLTPPSRNGDAPAGDETETVTASQQRILDSLAAFEPLGVMSLVREVVAAYATARPTSGGFKNNLGRLRTLGLVTYPTPNNVALTAAGRAVASPGGIIASRAQLHDAWLGIVTASQASILRTLIARYPSAMTREELAEQVGAPVTSGGFKNNLGRLRTLGVADYPEPNFVAATDALFPEGVPA